MLEAQPSGAGWWRLRYTFDGKPNRLSVGTYPEVSLASARQRRREALALIAAGTDPSDERKADKAVEARKIESARLPDSGLPEPGTFEYVASEWLQPVRKIKVSAVHAERTQIRLEKDAFPWLGRRPLHEIEPAELLQTLRRVEARGAIETAHRLKDACGQVFRYGMASGECKRNPAADLREALKPVQTTRLAAIADPKGGGKLMRDIRDYEGQPVTRAALELSALLLLRPGELCHMVMGLDRLRWGHADRAARNDEAQQGRQGRWPAALGAPGAQGHRRPQGLAALTRPGRYVFPWFFLRTVAYIGIR